MILSTFEILFIENETGKNSFGKKVAAAGKNVQ